MYAIVKAVSWLKKISLKKLAVDAQVWIYPELLLRANNFH